MSETPGERVVALEDELRSYLSDEVGGFDSGTSLDDCIDTVMRLAKKHLLASAPEREELREQEMIEAAGRAASKVYEFFRELGDWNPNGNHELEYCLQSYLEEIIKGNLSALAPTDLTKICRWFQGKDGSYLSTCDATWASIFPFGTLNGMLCKKCGKPIKMIAASGDEPPLAPGLRLIDGRIIQCDYCKGAWKKGEPDRHWSDCARPKREPGK